MKGKIRLEIEYDVETQDQDALTAWSHDVASRVQAEFNRHRMFGVEILCINSLDLITSIVPDESKENPYRGC